MIELNGAYWSSQEQVLSDTTHRSPPDILRFEYCHDRGDKVAKRFIDSSGRYLVAPETLVAHFFDEIIEKKAPRIEDISVFTILALCVLKSLVHPILVAAESLRG